MWNSCLLLMLALLALGGSSTPLFSSDNNRGQYRGDPSAWTKPWPSPILLTGQAPKGLHMSDQALHRQAETESSAFDFLYPSRWELGFEGSSICCFCRRFWWVSYFAAGLYIVGLRWGESAMKYREAWDLKWLLAAWNLFLALYSFIGAVRTTPHLLMLLVEHGFDYTLCRAALPMYGSGACGLWVALFIFSKYFELLDTVFLVVRKKPVGFLHWYHHFSVLLYTWHAYVWETPTGIYFVSMNYFVHAIMYFYYFLAGVWKPPRWALLVTILQLSQMVGGIYATVSHLHRLYYHAIPACDGHVPNLLLALLMYSTYFYLFGEFLVKRYCRRRSSDSRSAKGSAGNANGTNGKASTGKKVD